MYFSNDSIDIDSDPKASFTPIARVYEQKPFWQKSRFFGGGMLKNWLTVLKVFFLILIVSALVVGGRRLMNQSQDLRRAASSNNPNQRVAKHLFLDNYLIDQRKSSNYQIKINPPRVVRLAITTDKPWEANGYHYYSQVLDYNLPFDGQNYKYILYYGRWKLTHLPGFQDEGGYLCVGLSNDGLQWTKPLFEGSSRFNGQNTNCLKYLSSGGNFILVDPHAPANQRFKLFGPLSAIVGAWGILGQSADGLVFTDVDKRIGPMHTDGKAYGLDSQNVVLWDNETEKFRFYVRGRSGTLLSRPNDYSNYSNVERAVNYGEIASTNLLDPRRFILNKSDNPNPMVVGGLIRTEDGYRLSTELPFTMEVADDEAARWTPREKATVDIYHSAAFKYPGTTSTFLAFPTLYYHYTRSTTPKAFGLNDGEFEPELAVSRDGTNWQRYRTADNYPPYVPRGEYAGVQMKMISMGQGMIFAQDKIYQYFIGLPRTHGSGFWYNGQYKNISSSKYDSDCGGGSGSCTAVWLRSNKGGVFVTEQRLDGFAAVSATSGHRAIVVTEPFVADKTKLTLNGRTQPGGGVKVALLNEQGQEINGYTTDQNQELKGDFVYQPVSWVNRQALDAELLGRPIRIKLTLDQAEVFSFNWQDVGAQPTPSLPVPTPTLAPTPPPGATPTPTLAPTPPGATPTPTRAPTPVDGGFSIGDRVWHDLNQNGLQDEGEVGLAGVKVVIFVKSEDGSLGGSVGSTESSANGFYRFDNLDPGKEYRLRFYRPSGYTYSPAYTEKQYAIDSNVQASAADATYGWSWFVSGRSGGYDQSIDAGFYQLAQ